MTDEQHDQLPLATSPASAQVDGLATSPPVDTAADGTEAIGDPTIRTAQRRRRGSRGGRNRRKPAGVGAVDGDDAADGDDGDDRDDEFFEPDDAITSTAG